MCIRDRLDTAFCLLNGSFTQLLHCYQNPSPTNNVHLTFNTLLLVIMPPLKQAMTSFMDSCAIVGLDINNGLLNCHLHFNTSFTFWISCINTLLKNVWELYVQHTSLDCMSSLKALWISVIDNGNSFLCLYCVHSKQVMCLVFFICNSRNIVIVLKLKLNASVKGKTWNFIFYFKIVHNNF